jgi:hypothetical protein
VIGETPSLHYYTYKDRFGITKTLNSDLPPKYMKSRGYFHVMSINNQKKINYSSQMNKIIQHIAQSQNTDEWLIQAIVLSQQRIPVSISNYDNTLTISNIIQKTGRRYTDGGLPDNFPDALVVVAQRMETDVNNTLNKYGPLLFRQKIESTGHQILKKLRINTNVQATGDLPQDLLMAAKTLESRIKNIHYIMSDIMKELIKATSNTQLKDQAKRH